MLLLTGQQSIFNNTTKALHLAILKAVADRTKVEFVEVAGVANVLEEKVPLFSLSQAPHCSFIVLAFKKKDFFTWKVLENQQ